MGMIERCHDLRWRSLKEEDSFRKWMNWIDFVITNFVLDIYMVEYITYIIYDNNLFNNAIK